MKGAKIDGIGSQIHININLRKQGIDNMFRKLAATGLKIKVLDWIYGLLIQHCPLFFEAAYFTKPAFSSFLQALKTNK